MNEITRVRRLLDEINEAISGYDPVLKEPARDLLLRTAFGGEVGPPAAAVEAVEAADTGASSSPEPRAKPARGARASRGTSMEKLLERWRPRRASESALLGAYYVARRQSGELVDSQSINTVLKKHDLVVSNITRAIETNLNADPPLMEQVRKLGSTKQARKQYRLTAAGISAVEQRLRPSPA